MSTPVSINDVASAAGVAKSTVSRVVGGKGDQSRICHDTQVRILAVARQLGYQPNQIARDVALGKGIKPLGGDEMTATRQVTVVLTTVSPPSSLALIPGLETVLTRANFQLVVVVVPADPASARERISRLLNIGCMAIVSCPTAVAMTIQAVNGLRPVVQLDAGNIPTLMQVLGVVNVQASIPPSISKAPPVTVKPTPVVPPPAAHPTVTPPPVIVADPIPVVVAAVPGGTAPEPAVVEPTPVIPQPPPEPVPTPEPEVTPTPEPVEPDPPPVIPPLPPSPVQEPIVTPESEIAIDPTTLSPVQELSRPATQTILPDETIEPEIKPNDTQNS